MTKSQIEEEFDEYDKKNNWHIIYERIRNEAAINREFEYSIKDARRPENRGRNRYRDVSPYDHSRVKLQKGEDYINASLVEVPNANRNYILAQGPLPGTAGHFWQMVWEQRSRAVIMLNRVMEKGTVKCYQYWPLGEVQGGNNAQIFEDVGIKVAFIREKPASYYTVRTLELEDMATGDKQEVLHFHYTTWPDFGVPQSPAAFLNFLMAVRNSGSLETTVGPAVVHCSAGIGRSGTFCLVDSCMILIERYHDPNVVDIKAMLLGMRKYRMGLIQTPDQLRFSYTAIIEAALRIMSNTLDDIQVLPSEMPAFINEDRYGLDDSSSSDEEPPPLPPRRSTNKAEVISTDDVTPETNLAQTDESQAILRRRRIEERKIKTAEIVRNMKKKQREHEIVRNRSFLEKYSKPICIGLSILVLGYAVYRMI